MRDMASREEQRKPDRLPEKGGRFFFFGKARAP
jgi:hypothetical protein